MLNLLPLVVVFPLAGFVVLTITRDRIAERVAAMVGVGSIGLAALVALLVGYEFLATSPAGGAHTQPLWTWMRVGDFAPRLALNLDGLSLTMLGVVTGVGFFIHLFAAWYMHGDEAFARFFAYMNLFVASMLFLVLGDDLLFVYFGWEGVGLCSYLLIGFWFKEPTNAVAARKAFVVTRVGDALMIISLFILYGSFGTLDIDNLARQAPQTWPVGSTIATVTCLLLLGGAVGKSAQLPLQTWLADAMAGPTPVSALIHAATMVTAGVYLIARLHGLFELSPIALECVGIVGATTLVLAGFAALMQTDIKRILAYSTMSQIGYMFLAEGVGAYGPGVFHLMTHAFFKALLFLSAGSVILAMHHEQDIFRMGGLRKHLPFPFACMLIGTFALCAVPFTSGYYSKDEILHLTYLSGHFDLWLAGLLGAFLTAVYSFRLIFVVFFGPERWKTLPGASAEPHPSQNLTHQIPLGVLLLLAIVGAAIHPPLTGVLPEAPIVARVAPDVVVAQLPIFVAFAGIALSWWLFLRAPDVPARLARGSATGWLGVLWQHGWGFDWLYDRLLVRPIVWLAGVCRNDPIDLIVDAVGAGSRGLNRLASLTQTGSLRWYAAVAAVGVCILIAIVFVQ